MTFWISAIVFGVVLGLTCRRFWRMARRVLTVPSRDTSAQSQEGVAE